MEYVAASKRKGTPAPGASGVGLEGVALGEASQARKDWFLRFL